MFRPAPTTDHLHVGQIRTTIRSIARRQWWLWSSTVVVTLLLALGIASFAFPALAPQSQELNLITRGLVGLVLLFNVHTIYQQVQIHRIQRLISDQVEALGTDPLTGLYDRRSGEERLAAEISRAERFAHPLTILLLDIDGLKAINDEFGHAAGDELIRRFAERLNKAIRGSDMAVRLGGDEFLVLLPECKLNGVGYVLNRLSGLTIDYDQKAIAVGFSAGWTDYKSSESAGELLKRADQALYTNKRAVRKRSEMQLFNS
jgi:diguanylate cyclase (GGDEF)-like protein